MLLHPDAMPPTVPGKLMFEPISGKEAQFSEKMPRSDAWPKLWAPQLPWDSVWVGSEALSVTLAWEGGIGQDMG